MNNIKSKTFYKEAEDMSKGWGKYLRSIDKLKNKVDKKRSISLNEACWILYGEGYCSFYWRKFEEYCIKNKWGNKLMPWEAWQGLFTNYTIL